MGMRLACVNLGDIVCSYSAAMATGPAPCFFVFFFPEVLRARKNVEETHEMAKPFGLV